MIDCHIVNKTPQWYTLRKPFDEKIKFDLNEISHINYKNTTHFFFKNNFIKNVKMMGIYINKDKARDESVEKEKRELV